MSVVPISKYLMGIPLAGFIFVILNFVLDTLAPYGEDTVLLTILEWAWVGVPLLILVVSGIRGIMEYQKGRYTQ